MSPPSSNPNTAHPSPNPKPPPPSPNPSQPPPRSENPSPPHRLYKRSRLYEPYATDSFFGDSVLDLIETPVATHLSPIATYSWEETSNSGLDSVSTVVPETLPDFELAAAPETLPDGDVALASGSLAGGEVGVIS